MSRNFLWFVILVFAGWFIWVHFFRRVPVTR